MSTSAPFLSPGLSVLPADLSASQRSGLAACVVLGHVLVALAVLSRAIDPVVLKEPAPIEVSLISSEAALAADAPSLAPTPKLLDKTPVSEPVPLVHKPVRPSPVDQLPAVRPAVPLPLQKAPALVTSTSAQSAQTVQAQTPAAPTTATPTPLPVPASEARGMAAPAVTPPLALQSTTSPAGPVTTPLPGAGSARPSATPVDLPSSALRYLIEPKLNYPRVSRELGESGVVQLRVQIDEQGRPRQIQLAKSSGFPRLDQEAMRAMHAARFQSRIVDGVPRAVTTTATLGFDLDEQ